MRDPWFARLRDAYLEPGARAFDRRSTSPIALGPVAQLFAWQRHRVRDAGEAAGGFDDDFASVLRRRARAGRRSGRLIGTHYTFGVTELTEREVASRVPGLIDEKLKVLSRREPLTVRPGTSLRSCLDLIRETGTADSVFVTDADGRLLGVLTERDIFAQARRARRRPHAAGRAADDRPPEHAPPRRARPARRRAHADRAASGTCRWSTTTPCSSASSARSTSSSTSPRRSPRSSSTCRRGRTSAWSPRRARDPDRGSEPVSTEAPPSRASPPRSSSSGSRSGSPAIPATACSSPARSSPGPRPPSATTSAPTRTSRPRSARPPARCPACPASS